MKEKLRKKERKGKNKMSTNNGITLVALVVTIVVLLILAGITIMYVMGDNSVFKQASDAKIETELGKIEEQAGLIYSNKLVANKGGSVSNREIIDELNRNGNKIEIRSAGATAVESISVEPTEISMDKSKTATITVKINGSEDGNYYYAVIDGKYYKITFKGSQLTISREAEKAAPEGSVVETASIEVVTEGELKYDNTIVTNVQINQSAKTVEIGSGTAFGETTLTIKYGSKTAECKVTVEEAESNWSKIAEMAAKIAKGEATNAIGTIKVNGVDKEVSSKKVTIDGKEETITVGEEFKVRYTVSGTNSQLLKVRVLGFNHDTLAEATDYGAVGSKAGISFEFIEFVGGMDRMHSSKDNSVGWKGSEMRAYLNEGLSSTTPATPALITKLSNAGYIKTVTKPYLLGSGAETASTDCSDKLWLLSCSEIWANGVGNGAKYGSAKEKEGDQYEYYQVVSPDGSNSVTNTYLQKKTARRWS